MSDRERPETGCECPQARLTGTQLHFSEAPCWFPPTGGGVEQGQQFMLVTRRPEVSRVRHLDSTNVFKIRPPTYWLCVSSGASLDLEARLETRLMIWVHTACGDQGRVLQSHECPPSWCLARFEIMLYAVTNASISVTLPSENLLPACPRAQRLWSDVAGLLAGIQGCGPFLSQFSYHQSHQREESRGHMPLTEGALGIAAASQGQVCPLEGEAHLLGKYQPSPPQLGGGPGMSNQHLGIESPPPGKGQVRVRSG